MSAPSHSLHSASVPGNPPSRRLFQPLASIVRIPAWFTLTIALVPVISWFVKRLDDGSDEPLGLLALALAAALAWRDRKSLHASKTASVIGALAILLSVLGIGFLPPMVRALIAIAGLGACFGIHRKPGIMGLAVLSLPVITSLQFYAGYPMRLAAAEGSVRLLELGGVVVSRSGVDIIIGGVEVSVDPACSGIRMAWHALAAVMAMAAVHRVSWRGTLTGAALAGLLIVPANIVRSTWLALEECGKFQSTGLGHEGVGLLSFGIILIPLWLWISKRARPAPIAAITSSGHAAGRVILFAAALFTPVCMLRSHAPDSAPPLGGPPSTFTFDGLTLPLSSPALQRYRTRLREILSGIHFQPWLGHAPGHPPPRDPRHPQAPSVPRLPPRRRF